MDVEIRLFATFREAVGQKTITREFPASVTVGEVLESLEAEFEGLAGNILDGDELQPQLNILKNGRDVSYLEGLAEPLEPGDRLSVFPPVAGG